MEVVERIKLAKAELGAIILAHYYQDAAIQDLADFVGDSLDLARRAQATNARTIVFCGVHFMAETAKILNPQATVFLPDVNAGCSLADSCSGEDLRQWREEHPDHYVVSYINCSASAKAQSDVICTSSNVLKIVDSIPENRPILFAPDRNLGRWVMGQTGRQMDLWPGSCIVHESFDEERFMEIWLQNKDAQVIAHPECEEHMLRLADFVGSTSALLRRISEAQNQKFIVLTEPGIFHKMREVAPSNTYIPVPNSNGCACNECPYMRMNTLEKLARCMEALGPEIVMGEDLRLKALRPLELMLELSR